MMIVRRLAERQSRVGSVYRRLLRHRGPLVDARISPAEADSTDRGGSREPAPLGGRWLVETESPVWAAAPGQAAVFYDGERCLGGGRIVERAA